MNDQNNNNVTLNTDIDPSLYTNLKKKQQAFIHCIAESLGSMTKQEFPRKELKQIANDHGIAWAPAWIVKDKNRCVKRGIYSVPELAAYRNHMNAQPPVEEKDVVAECCEDVVGDKVEVPKVEVA